MSDTQQLLNDLVVNLYREASSSYNLRFLPYQDNHIIKAADGTFLGSFGSRYSANSIFNEYGIYGSKYSATSIFNVYGVYGSLYSALSPYNTFSSSPPQILDVNNNILGYLTANKYHVRAIDPNSIIIKAIYDMDLVGSVDIPGLLREY
jgi:hypothetical protein